MNTSFPSALVRAYLAALGQIAAHLQPGRVPRQQQPAGPHPGRRSGDRNASSPQNR
jgi:hypothetical protein